MQADAVSGGRSQHDAEKTSGNRSGRDGGDNPDYEAEQAPPIKRPHPLPGPTQIAGARDAPSIPDVDQSPPAATRKGDNPSDNAPAVDEQPEPEPRPDLSPTTTPERPDQPAMEPVRFHGVPTAGAEPVEVLNSDELAALLDRPDQAEAQGDKHPAAALYRQARLRAGTPPPAQDHLDAREAGPFVGDVEEIEPDEPKTGAVEGAPAEPGPRRETAEQDLGQDDQAEAVSPQPAASREAPDKADVEGAHAEDVGTQLAAVILDEAVERGASHLHLLLASEAPQLQLRIAGRIVSKPNFSQLAPHQTRALLTRLLALAGLARADLSRPRVGRIVHTAGAVRTEMTLSAVPTIAGPRIVITVAPRDAEASPDLTALGLATGEAERLGAMLARPGGGLLLVCGPDRVDRNDVLVALAGKLTSSRRDVLVISSGRAGQDADPWDPPAAELLVPGACNACVDPVSGYHYRDAARLLWRQDADALVLAELTDPQTAAAALEAAQAGSLVAAGVSAATAADALGLLAEMDIQGWPLAARLRGLIVRKAARDESASPAALVEPGRQLVRLIRESADAETIADLVPEAGHQALTDAAGRMADDPERPL
jgi:type II secretory ATPase GspE/PulE/Tfp pilus assembly ATPase PilB-like protein